MRRLSAEELRAAKADHDYRLLWEQALPLVKFAVGQLVRGGMNSAACTEDMLQDGNLAAGRAVRTWDPKKGEFATWVVARVQGAIRNHLTRERSGMVGGRDAHGQTAHLEEEAALSPDDDILTEMQLAEAADIIQGSLHEIPRRDSNLLRMKHGLFGVSPLAVAEIAYRFGAPLRTTERAIAQAFKKLAGIVRKSGYFL